MAQKLSEIAAAARLEQFFGRVGTYLKDWRKRESFAMYAFGILGDGERKGWGSRSELRAEQTLKSTEEQMRHPQLQGGGSWLQQYSSKQLTFPIAKRRGSGSA